MSGESKIIKFIGTGIFICMVSILNKISLNKQLTTVNSIPISSSETAPKQVVILSENRIAVVNTNKDSMYYGWVRIYEYDKDKKTFNKISDLGE